VVTEAFPEHDEIGTGESVDLTVLILSYNVRELLALALRTAQSAARGLSVELLVVDNDSPDGSADMVEQDFPDVRLVRSGGNLGFAGGNNLGMKVARGRYILLLNPDVLVHPRAFAVLIDYMNAHPEVGAAGGRVILGDGSIDHGAKRGFPSPAAAFYRMVGLSYLFPRSPRFGRYNMTFLDDNEEAEVEGLSGAFMCVRRAVIDQVGGLDEAFFMYGEDLDWSYRITEAGWKLAYVPSAEIVHFKGESARTMPKLRQLYEFHRAMVIFVRKHIAKNRNPVSVALIEAGIVLRGIGVTLWRFFLAILRPLLDLFLLTIAVLLALLTRTLSGWTVPPFSGKEWVLIAIVFILSGITGAAVTGLYRKQPGAMDKADAGRAMLAAAVGAAICIVAVFFIKTINFSRIVTALAWVYAGGLGAAWRWLAAPSGNRPSGRGIVIGCGARAETFLDAYVKPAHNYRVMGVVRGSDDDSACSSVAGYPVIGDLSDLPILLRRLKVDDVIVAWEHFRYADVLGLARRGGGYPQRVRLVPDGLELNGAAKSAQSEGEWPLIDVKLPKRSVI